MKQQIINAQTLTHRFPRRREVARRASSAGFSPAANDPAPYAAPALNAPTPLFAPHSHHRIAPNKPSYPHSMNHNR
ncbi:hypothetical protein EON83_24100 [bacterium]|nr:MAG: hypothetical protein EON83_24100 [bacterium]